MIACQERSHEKAGSLPYGEFKSKIKTKEPSNTALIYQLNEKVERLNAAKSWDSVFVR